MLLRLKTSERYAAKPDPRQYEFGFLVEADIAEAERARLAVQWNPSSHRKSLVFDVRQQDRITYRRTLWGEDGKGRRVFFCWSCHRNLAGHFLTWREVVGKARLKRDRFDSCRKKEVAMLTVRLSLRAETVEVVGRWERNGRRENRALARH